MFDIFLKTPWVMLFTLISIAAPIVLAQPTSQPYFAHPPTYVPTNPASLSPDAFREAAKQTAKQQAEEQKNQNPSLLSQLPPFKPAPLKEVQEQSGPTSLSNHAPGQSSGINTSSSTNMATANTPSAEPPSAAPSVPAAKPVSPPAAQPEIYSGFSNSNTTHSGKSNNAPANTGSSSGGWNIKY